MPFDTDNMPRTVGLAGRAMASLRAYFATRNHNPSADHWAALEDIARTLEAMADGECPRKVLLSSCDPGVGKSQTVTHFMRAMVADPAYRHVGAVICVGRIEEAVSIAGDLGLAPDQFAVLTSNDEANAIGHHLVDAAPVLITTKQRIELHCHGASFDGAAEFHYQGQPRQVRVWDEAWLPGVAVALNRDDLGGLFKPLRYRFPAMANALEDMFVALRSVADGACFQVPDFEHTHGAGLHDALGAVAGGRDDHQATVTGLFILSGKTARVRHDGVTGNAVLTYEDTLPTDLAPLLVLDASGRVRRTYADIERHRGTLERLKTATKDYSPLSVHVWETSGSKAGWRDNGAELLTGIVKTILSKPSETWLIVHHKAAGRLPDVAQSVADKLPPDVAARVRYVTWGKHMATNAYADVANVILAGTLFMRPSFYTALTHLAQGKPTGCHMVADDAVQRTIQGEHANLLLQAICRGRVRKLDGDRCLPMSAYVIAAASHGLLGHSETSSQAAPWSRGSRTN